VGIVNIVVGVSDLKVSNEIDNMLVTYSLGSCIGVAIYDPIVKVAGLLHFMLPESSLDRNKAQNSPYMFADTGIPMLFKRSYEYGAQKKRLKVIVVGGSQVLDQDGYFNIGKRNYMAVRKILWKNNVMIDYEDVGGNSNRTIKMAVKDGRITLKVSGLGEKDICLT
jgi:chemotaxis protein CheD